MSRFPIRAAFLLSLVFAASCCSESLAQNPAADRTSKDALVETREVALQVQNIKYRSTNHQFDDVDAEWLSGWLRRFGVELPKDISGKISTDIEIQWPFGALTNPNQYRIRAAVESDRLKFGPLELGDVKADVDYRNGVAFLRSLSFDLLEEVADSEDGNKDGSRKAVVRGRVEGKATGQLLPLDEITLDVRFKDLSAIYVANELGVEVPELTGTLSGEVTARSDFDSFRTIKGWQGEGKLNGKDLSALGRPKSDLRDAQLELKDGQLQLQRFVVETEGGVVSADGVIDLANAFPWKLQTRLERFELSEASKWAGVEELDASGKVTGNLDLTGTVNPVAWKADGNLKSESATVEQIQFANAQGSINASGSDQADNLRAAGEASAESVRGPGFGRGRIDRISADYRLGDSVVELTNVRGKVGDGSLQAKATWPLNNDGTANAEGNWQDVDFGPFLLSNGTQLSIDADSDGDFRWSAPVANLEDLSQHKLAGKANIPNVVVNGNPSGELGLVISQSDDPDRAGQVEYKLSGDMFGGTVEGEGTLTALRDQAVALNDAAGNQAVKEDVAEDAPPAVDGAPLGSFRLKDLDLAQFAQTVFRGMDRIWQGRLSLSVQITPDGTSQGQLEIARLRYADSLVTDLLKGEFRADTKEILLDRISGRVLGGRLSSRGKIDYSGRGQLSLQLSRIDSRQVANMVYPWLGEYFDGPVNVSLRAAGSNSWRATGTITGSKTRIGVFDVQRLRAPVIVGISPSGVISIESRDIRGSLAKGRISGKGKVVRRASGIDLASQWKLSQVGIQSIEDALGGSGAIATGDMSGTMTFNGKRMNEFRDLKGALRLEFHDAGARSLPLISQLQRFAIGIDLNSTKFRTGQMIAKLGRGQFSIEELRLVSPQLAVFVEGQYAPFTDRVDLEITASTAEGTARNAARRVIVSRLSVVTPVTAAMANINEFISDRVIQVHVGGTIRSPHFTLRPCPTLQQEVLRFFVRQLTAEIVDLEL